LAWLDEVDGDEKVVGGMRTLYNKHGKTGEGKGSAKK